MGMFDSMIDERGNEWQTKAYGCDLETYRIGDQMPSDEWSDTYQVGILGGSIDDIPDDSLATVRDNILSSVGDERDPTLPLLDRFGGWLIPDVSAASDG